MSKTTARILSLVAIAAVLTLALIWVMREPPVAADMTSSIAIGDDPHGQLLDLIRDGTDKPELTANLQNDLTAAFQADPRFTQLETRSPGTIREIVSALAPLMEKRSKRLFAEHRPELGAVLKSGVSTSEAAEAVRFFASPTGSKMLQMVAANSTMRETYGSATAGQPVSDAEIVAHMDRDRQTMKQRVLAQLAPEEIARIESELTSKQWIRSFNAIMPQFKAALARLENAPLSAEEDKAMNDVVNGVLARRGIKQ